MNVLAIVEEIVKQRPYTRKPWGRRRRRVNGHTRPLDARELAEFRAHISACLKLKCKPTAPCWEPGCPRCKPA